LALQLTKWNLESVSDELPLCELPRTTGAMIRSTTRIRASCNDALITFFCSAAGVAVQSRTYGSFVLAITSRLLAPNLRAQLGTFQSAFNASISCASVNSSGRFQTASSSRSAIPLSALTAVAFCNSCIEENRGGLRGGKRSQLNRNVGLISPVKFACFRSVAGCAPSTGFAGHASATADLELTSNTGHSLGAGHSNIARGFRRLLGPELCIGFKWVP
jgi:hypothetical protein